MDVQRPREKLLPRSLALVIVGGLAISACSSSKPEATARTKATAACVSLAVDVTKPPKHDITASVEYTLSHGARYEGTTYIFDPKLPSVTVEAPGNPSGRVRHEYPQKPANQTRTITAVINYSYPGSHGTFGAVDTCSVEVPLGPLAAIPVS